MVREGQERAPLEDEARDAARGEHEEIERVEGSTEERNPEVLKELGGGADEDDAQASDSWGRKTMHPRETDTEEEDSDEGEGKVDEVARDEGAKGTAVVGAGDEAKGGRGEAERHDDGLARRRMRGHFGPCTERVDDCGAPDPRAINSRSASSSTHPHIPPR